MKNLAKRVSLLIITAAVALVCSSSLQAKGTGDCGPHKETCREKEICYADDHCVLCPADQAWCPSAKACVDLRRDQNNCNGCGIKAKPEICGDGVDNNCDGRIDEDVCK